MPDDSARAANVACVRRLGLAAYEPTWRAMQSFTLSRHATTDDEIWLTEHPPIYTLGLAGRMQHLRDSHGIPVLKVDRGGQVTYHGPGQLVAYVLVDLRRRNLGVRTMVRAIEAAVIDWLHAFGVDGYGRESAPGVYVRRHGAEAKIASIGLRVKNACTYHGVSVNLAMDLTPFDHIDPCGYPGMAVTQLAAFTQAPSVGAAGDTLAPLLFQHIAAAQS